MRSFIALKLSAETMTSLADLVGRLRGQAGRISWVDPDKLHLTLKFLGHLPSNKLEEANRALSLIAAETIPFGYSVESLGCFPNLRSPRVIWTGLQGNLQALSELQNKIDKGMEWLGFERDRQGFKPHITIGRVKGTTNNAYLEGQMKDARDEFFGEEWVDRFYLLKSDLKPSGAEYSVIREFKFI